MNLLIIFCRPSSVIRRPPSAVPPLQSPAFLSEMVRCTTLFMLALKVNAFAKKGTNLIVFMVNTNVKCRICMFIRNI